SISDIGTALLSGASLCIEDPDAIASPARLIALIDARRITHLDVPPAVLRVMDPSSASSSLRTIIVGGEPCPPAVIRSWAGRVRVVSVYGPTEATVCASLCVCDPATWTRPVLGRPIPNTSFRLLDADQHAARPGSPAELYIGGVGLARAYLNRPDLTASKFV